MQIWPLPKIEFTSFDRVEETRPVALVTSGPAWDAVCDRLRLPIIWQANVSEATLAHWQTLAPRPGPQSRDAAVVYAIGGGLAVDAAKCLAAQRDLPLVCLPTALSVDAFLTWASGVRREGCVYYVETKPPDRLVVDFEVLAAAPTPIRAAALCDVLSIATGSWDRRFAKEKDKNPAGMAYVACADRVAAGILQGALDCAEAAGRGDRDGLKQLLDCLALEVQLCNQLGHSRPKEGSEHYFAHAAENELGKGLTHGALVGPGIVLMAERQGQDVAPLRRALEACHVPLDRIPAAAVEATMRTLPQYVRHHGLPFGIAHDLKRG